MSTKQKPTSKHVIILSGIVALLALGMVLNAFVTAHLFRENSEQDNNHIAALIINAAEETSRPIPVDAAGNYYVPTARLTLPAPPSSLGEVLYSYAPQGKDLPEEVRLVSKNALRSAKYLLQQRGNSTEVVFNAVPRLQSCARGVQITFTPRTSQQAEATRPLANGKTAHFYVESLCDNAQLLEYARQIESY